MRNRLALALAAIGCALCLSTPSRAQTDFSVYPMAAAERAAVQSVIQKQVDAFLRDDGEQAFSFASPTIRERFRTAENFMTMVRSGYPSVYRPQIFEFREVVQLAGGPAQTAYVVGPDGVPRLAVYPMEQQSDGSWRINGCYLLEISNEST